MTIIYLMVVMSPLAPLALASPRLAHAITGECSGDCDIDGCPLESRANHTCCCWKKRETPVPVAANTQKSCCAPKTAPSAPAPYAHCAAPATAPAADHGKEAPPIPQADRDAVPPDAVDADDRASGTVVLKCGSPCGNGRLLSLTNGFKHEAMPFRYAGIATPPHASVLHDDYHQRLTSRHSEPPDPPPKLSTVS